MRRGIAAVGLGAPNLTAVLLTHLHSDHITDLGDVITTRWVMTFAPTPLTIVGPVGTRAVVDHLLASLAPDIGYRLAHHADLTAPPSVDVVEVADGPVALPGAVMVRCAPTDHRPVEPTVAYRFEHAGASVVTAGDTIPCAGIDRRACDADVLVHCCYMASAEAENEHFRRLLRHTMSGGDTVGKTAAHANAKALVLTHHRPRKDERMLEALAEEVARDFSGRIIIGEDLMEIDL